MNHVGKEMAKSVLRDRRVRSSATATMEYETVKEMYTDLRGGLSPGGQNISCRISMWIYVTGSNLRRMAGDLRISRGGQSSFRYFSFPLGRT